MNNISSEDIIEALIFEPQTATQLASAFSVSKETIRLVLAELHLAGRIEKTWPDGPILPEADYFCWCCGNQNLSRKEPCRKCGSWLDLCNWTYIGGPISEALAAA